MVKSYLLTSIKMRKSECVDCSRVLFFLGWWPLLFSQEWWGHIRYEVCGSPSICCWRKSIVSRIVGHNQHPTVPEVQDPNNSPRAFHRAGGQSRSFNVRQNRYSYVTAGASTGFGGEIVGLKPPQSSLGIPWWCPPCSPRDYV
jgi:hypothetical protein